VAPTANINLTALAQDKASSGADGVLITDFERSCLRFRIDVEGTRNRLIALA
jgi:hypothetical protein